MRNCTGTAFLLLLFAFTQTVAASGRFGMYDDSEWSVTIAHNTSGFAMGSCGEGFLLEIPKGAGDIKLDITLVFVGSDNNESYTGMIHTRLDGSSGGRAGKSYVESPDLCFDIKEVVITKATGTINGKQRDLLGENKLSQSSFVPHPIRLGKPSP